MDQIICVTETLTDVKCESISVSFYVNIKSVIWDGTLVRSVCASDLSALINTRSCMWLGLANKKVFG